MPVTVETRHVYVTSDGTDFMDKDKAEEYEEKWKMRVLLDDLQNVYWRETDPREVAEELYKAGYTIVEREKTK